MFSFITGTFFFFLLNSTLTLPKPLRTEKKKNRIKSFRKAFINIVVQVFQDTRLACLLNPTAVQPQMDGLSLEDTSLHNHF